MINLEKLKRDKYNKAIINSDNDSYKMYLLDTKKSREINNTIEDVRKLKQDINEIKDMLRLLLENRNG